MTPKPSRSLMVLGVTFLAITIPIETIYSWRFGLWDPYYLVKVAGWLLLAVGMVQVGPVRKHGSATLVACGWAWMSANFWRATADRVGRLEVGQALRLGSVEVWFAGSCLLVSLTGLAWSLVLSSRERA